MLSNKAFQQNMGQPHFNMLKTFHPALFDGVSVKPLQFGLFWKKQNKELAQSLSTQAVASPSDDQSDVIELKHTKHPPKPSYGRKNIRNGLLALLAFVGFIKMPGVVDNGHDWSRDRVNSTAGPAVEHPLSHKGDQNFLVRLINQGTDPFGDLVIKGAKQVDNFLDETPVVSSVANFAEDTIAHVDNAIQSTPVTNHIWWYYEQFFRWGMLFYTSMLLMRAALHKNIDLKGVYSDLHKQGITGKGLKAGLVTSGLLSGDHVARESFKLYNVIQEKPEKGEHDGNGTGTAMANILKTAMPDSQLVGHVDSEGKIKHEMVRRMHEILRSDAMEPLEKVRYLYEPYVAYLAAGVRKTIDEGAQVVGVSASLDPAMHLERFKEIFGDFVFSQNPIIRKHIQHFEPKPDNMRLDYPAELGKLFKYMLNDLAQEMLSPAMASGLSDLLAPWKEVLDYAQQKNVPVVISAGEAGPHHNKRPNIIGNLNLLALVDHPAQITVGSASSSGRVSAFASEGSEEIKPLVSGNGSGEISTHGRIKQDWFSWLRFPLSKYKKHLLLQNPHGGAYAVADVTSVILMMKQFYPNISNEDVRILLQKTAQPTKPTLGVLEPSFGLLSMYSLINLLGAFQHWMLEQSSELDPVNSSQFIQKLEDALIKEFNDPVLSAQITRYIQEMQINKKAMRENPNEAKVSKAAVEGDFTDEEFERAKKVFFEVLSTFKVDTHNTNYLPSRINRQSGAGLVNGKAAALEAQKLAQSRKLAHLQNNPEKQ